MIVFIESLIDRELAYVTNTGVYFNVRKFVEYGKLSGQSVDQMLSGVRKESDETKSDPLDFALWKRSKENEPFWNSPWGNGRPGWHIECSVMSMKYLGQTMDIHAGGRDLVFPHHENEIAQSQSLTGKPFANYWIHHGLLTINGQKMSKSLGNFITIKEVLKKYPPEVLKILYLQTHYSHPVDFSWEKMEEARKAYERIDIVVDKIEKCLQSDSDKYSKPGVSDFQKQFMDSMDDDFNMPKGLAVLFAVVSAANKILEEGAGEDKTSLSCALADIRLISSVYGLMFSVDKPTNICDDEIIAQINQRLEYKKAKDFIAADTIRKNLEAKGIILEDTREGTTWRRKI
jgi:cysteinyl-tRNA synthetase